MNNKKSSEQTIEEYLKNAAVLIIDQNSSARTGLRKTITSMGANQLKVYTTGCFAEAEEIINKHLPLVILCDYQIGDRYGIELLQKLKENNYKDIKKAIFVIVTANTSQSAVAQAAEEDIDAYVLKPYTLVGLKHSISQAIFSKILPSEYAKIINKGKEKFERTDYDDAIRLFQEASTKDSRPALACYYEGLTQFTKKSTSNSKHCYRKGLTYNRIHYKCLAGLVDLLNSLNEYEEAYKAIRTMVKFFPANPKRLSTVLKLAIQTKNYGDVEQFYQEFLKIEERNEQIVTNICAALIICGKHFFSESQPTVAIDLIQKAAVTSAGKNSLLKKAVEVLVENNQTIEAGDVLKRFIDHNPQNPDFATSSFLIYSKENDDGRTISEGLNLINKGINSPEIFKITIECLKRSNKKDRAQEITSKALMIFPEMESEFKKAA